MVVELHRRNFSVVAIAMCPSMDLIAIVQIDKTVVLYRTFAWERVASIPASSMQGAATALGFSPDGKYLCIGQDNGRLVHFTIESGAMQTIECEATAPIRRILWHYASPASTPTILHMHSGTQEPAADTLPLIVTMNSENVTQVIAAGGVPFAAYVHPPSIAIALVGITADTILLQSGDQVTQLRPPQLQQREIYHRLASLLLSIRADLRCLTDLCSSSARKWKEALKPISPKLALMQSTLKGYNFQMTLLEFLFSVAQAGNWHPAANMIFSSQWNDQNLSRLRSIVDTTSKQILRSLVYTTLATATNVHVKSTELSALAATADTDFMASVHPHFLALVHAAKAMLVKVDEAIREARLARDNLLLFLQFVKDSMQTATATEGTPAAFSIESRVHYTRLFDPRMCRCADDFSPTAHPEVVSASCLFAFLQEGALPIDTRRRSKMHSDGFFQRMRTVADTDSTELQNSHSLVDLVKNAQSELTQILRLVHRVVDIPAPPPQLNRDLQWASAFIAPPESLSIPIAEAAGKKTLQQAAVQIGWSSSALAVYCSERGEGPHWVSLVDVLPAVISRVHCVQLSHGADKTAAIVMIVEKHDASWALCRIPLEALLFTLSPPPNSAGVELIGGVPIDSLSDVSWLQLDIKSCRELIVCGARGTACIVESGSGLCVVDLEGEDEEDEEQGDSFEE